MIDCAANACSREKSPGSLADLERRKAPCAERAGSPRARPRRKALACCGLWDSTGTGERGGSAAEVLLAEVWAAEVESERDGVQTGEAKALSWR